MSLNLHAMFVPSIGILEVFLRGTIMYFALFAILRFMARRQAGQFSPADLLVIVLIADAAQNALGKDYGSVTEGIVLVSTIVAWDYVIDWISWRFPALRPIFNPPSIMLVENGSPLTQNLRQEMLTLEELMSQLRQHEIVNLKDVQCAHLEGDGRISVIKRKG